MRYRLRTLLIVMATIVMLAGVLIYSWRAAKVQETAIDAFSTTIPLGMPRSQVDQICKAASVEHRGWKYWPEVTPHGSSVAEIESPVTFGVPNHVVYIVFDYYVFAAVLVRTLYTHTQRPS